MGCVGRAGALAGCTDDRADPADPSADTDRRANPTPEADHLRPVPPAGPTGIRPFELVAPGFVAADLGSRGSRLPATVTLHARGPEAPFAAVEAALPLPAGTIALGLGTEDGDHVLVRWKAETSRVTLEVRTGGQHPGAPTPQGQARGRRRRSPSPCARTR